MTPGAILLCVATVLYLLECLLWVPGGRVALISGPRGRFRIVEPSELFRVAGGAFALLFPLPPLGRAVLLDERPITPEDLALEPVEERIHQWRIESVWLRIAANVLFVDLFLVWPAVVATRGLLASWLPLLVGLLALEALTIFEFVFVHRALYPGRLAARLGRTLLMLVSPPACIRAEDGISREVLGSAHPLAACVLLCEPESTERYLRRTLYDAGCLDAGSGDELGPRIDELLASAKLSLEGLRAAPAIPEPGASSYCPRCHAQYVPERATCDSCGLETRRFSAD